MLFIGSCIVMATGGLACVIVSMNALGNVSLAFATTFLEWALTLPHPDHSCSSFRPHPDQTPLSSYLRLPMDCKRSSLLWMFALALYFFALWSMQQLSRWPGCSGWCSPILNFPGDSVRQWSPEYVNEVIAAMIEISCVEHRLITPYNPRADGKVCSSAYLSGAGS